MDDLISSSQDVFNQAIRKTPSPKLSHKRDKSDISNDNLELVSDSKNISRICIIIVTHFHCSIQYGLSSYQVVEKVLCVKGTLWVSESFVNMYATQKN